MLPTEVELAQLVACMAWVWAMSALRKGPRFESQWRQDVFPYELNNAEFIEQHEQRFILKICNDYIQNDNI